MSPRQLAPIQIAIETSGRTASIALLEGDTLLRSYFLNDRKRTAATLAPTLKQCLEDCSESGWTISFISIADGPGSFTGLRIGVTTAKTLAYARQIPLVRVDSIAAIAAGAMTEFPDLARVLVLMDAYRGQLFTGTFGRSWLLDDPSHPDGRPELPEERGNVRVIQRSELESLVVAETESAGGGNEPAAELFVTGDAKTTSHWSGSSQVLKRRCRPDGEPEVVDAVGVGRLGWRAFTANRFVDPVALVPRYLRPSAAEEVRDANESRAVKVGTVGGGTSSLMD